MKTKLRQSIVNHLLEKGNYDETVDDYVIDMLLENIEYAKDAKKDILENGLVLEMTSGNGFTTTKMNPSFGIYQMCLRNIHQCSTKLGINRNDRLKLKLIEQKEKDDLDKLLEG